MFLLAYQLRVSVGGSGLCCVRVTSFERGLAPLFVACLLACFCFISFSSYNFKTVIFIACQEQELVLRAAFMETLCTARCRALS